MTTSRRRDDALAAAAIDRDGGPGAGSIPGKGIDPVVMMGTLESLLTGASDEQVASDPRSGHAVAERDGGERLVIALTDSLAAALAATDAKKLHAVAKPWCETEEFWGQGEPAVVEKFLAELASLARRATDRGERLYCWVCV
ncbi:MAG: hypothetical protein JST54_19565 [Deltaproteobacteria bacterium]|nr:hypothetical protein [Deltaproteobacteria bacterium]